MIIPNVSFGSWWVTNNTFKNLMIVEQTCEFKANCYLSGRTLRKVIKRSGLELGVQLIPRRKMLE